jgi:signal transduction histidine kinase|uniref:histidine kinase n=1 Tax=Desulfomonile tiedjei TaxID=2358 RepID=A0A7C4AT73_9BACT
MPDSPFASAPLSRPSLSAAEILRLKALKEAVGGFAHELSQPLNALMIASQVIKMVVEKSALSQSERSFILQRLDIVTTQVRKASNTIDAMRTFVRGAAQTNDATDVREVVDFTLSLMGQQLSARGIRLVRNIADYPLLTRLNRAASECIMIAATAYARDLIETQTKEIDEAASEDSRVLEIDAVLVEKSPCIHLHWPKVRGEGFKVSDEAAFHEACVVMADAGGKIDITSSELTLWFPGVE